MKEYIKSNIRSLQEYGSVFGDGEGEMNSDFIKGRVSIVTPILNGESYLSRMLDSVLLQSYQNIEMILVDGGSTDRTLVIADAYGKLFRAAGIEYHVIKGYGNAAAAMNQGFPLVRGEFLIWPDGDDVLENDSIRKRVEFLQSHLQYQCVRSLGYYVEEKTENRVEPDERLGDLDNEELFFPILYSETFVCCGCYMFRSKCFFEIYPQRKIPESDVGRNFQMLLPFTYRFRCPTIKEELYRVYIRPGSMSRTPLSKEQEKKKCADLEKLVDAIVEICQITTRSEVRKIEAWKARVRYNLYRKNGEKGKAAMELLQLYKNGYLSLYRLIRSFGGVLLGKQVSKIKWIMEGKFETK